MIYGGTSAGVMAAVQVARMGLRALIVEPGYHLGGMCVEGLGSSDIDNHPEFQNSPAVGGLALEYYRRISERYHRREAFEEMLAARRKVPELWRFEPHVAEEVFNSLVREHGVMVILGKRLDQEHGARLDANGRISALRCEDGTQVPGTVFIDATYEGDLLAAAGVSTTIGREPNRLYGETLNGIRGENTYRQFEVRVDPYCTPGDPQSGVIPTIQDEPLGTPGEGDHRVQAYCFRLCLTRDPANMIPFSRPPGYDPWQYEIYRRYAEACGHLWIPAANIPHGKTDLGSWHALSANLYGMNHAYPGGSYEVRERVLREHLLFTQGLCWFLANDPRVPREIREEWSQWGLAKDEFVDNHGWPRRFYVREARRMVSDYVITEHHTSGRASVPDPAAVAYWPPDMHATRRIVRDGAAYNEGFVFGERKWGPFGISYRALVPRSEECGNLITPTTLSASHVGYGAVRLEWTFMALAQAAATAAVIAIEDAVSLQEVSYPKLRARLLADGQVLELG